MSEENGSVQTGNPAEAGQQQSGQWFDGFQDATVKEWAATKGWKSPEAAVQSAWHLERLMGADKAGRGVIWPKDDNDADGFNQIYAKLGRPESPEGYELSVPEGMDDSFAKAVAPKLHELGVSKKQAQALAEFQNQWSAQYQERQEAEWADKSTKQFESLQKDWGADFERNSEVARRAIRMAGLDKDQADAIEKALGVDVASKVFFELGKAYVEHASPGGSVQIGNESQSAKARIQELKQDREFQTKIINGDAGATSEWNRLHKIAFG